MSKNKTHIIQKVQVDVFTSSMETGKLMERDMGSFIRKNILPVIEAYLDGLEDHLENQSLRIPALSLDIGISENGFPGIADLERQIIAQMDEVIKDEPTFYSPKSAFGASQNNKKTSPIKENLPETGMEGEKHSQHTLLIEDEDKDFLAWIFFLENGMLPWWYSLEQGKSNFQFPLLTANLKDGLKRKEVWRKLPKPEFFQRLISQYSGEELKNLLWLILAEKLPLNRSGFDKIFENLAPIEREEFYQILILLSHHSDSNTFAEIPFSLQMMVKDANRKLQIKILRTIQKIQNKQEIAEWEIFFTLLNGQMEDHLDQNAGSNRQDAQVESSVEEKNGVADSHYISHAGLILIHPFLKAFMSDCGFLDKSGKLIQPAMAVHALYYLANKQESPFDFELVFEKYLCGLDFHQPISRDIRLTHTIREKTDKLLESLLQHWKRLKNTGIETIRNEFLTRNGKLVLGEDQDRLFIERKAQDVLLDGLAWNLSIIKLPWRKKLLLVEW